MFRSILSQKNVVVRRTTRPQFLVVLTYFLVAKDVRTLEFCYPCKVCDNPGGIYGLVKLLKQELTFCFLYFKASQYVNDIKACTIFLRISVSIKCRLCKIFFFFFFVGEGGGGVIRKS